MDSGDKHGRQRSRRECGEKNSLDHLSYSVTGKRKGMPAVMRGIVDDLRLRKAHREYEKQTHENSQAGGGDGRCSTIGPIGCCSALIYHPRSPFLRLTRRIRVVHADSRVSWLGVVGRGRLPSEKSPVAVAAASSLTVAGAAPEFSPKSVTGFLPIDAAKLSRAPSGVQLESNPTSARCDRIMD